MRKSTKRPSPALIISLIALFVALGSGAYAAATIGTSDIKKKAVTGSKIANDAIKSSKVKDEKLKGKDLKDETIEGEKVAPETITRGKLDSSARTYWAVVSNPPGANNASIVRSSDPGFGIDEGTYVGVDFGKDVSQCAWTATRGNPGTGPETAGFVQVHLGPVNSEVRAAARLPDGTITDGDYHLKVKC